MISTEYSISDEDALICTQDMSIRWRTPIGIQVLPNGLMHLGTKNSSVTVSREMTTSRHTFRAAKEGRLRLDCWASIRCPRLNERDMDGCTVTSVCTRLHTGEVSAAASNVPRDWALSFGLLEQTHLASLTVSGSASVVRQDGHESTEAAFVQFEISAKTTEVRSLFDQVLIMTLNKPTLESQVTQWLDSAPTDPMTLDRAGRCVFHSLWYRTQLRQADLSEDEDRPTTVPIQFSLEVRPDTMTSSESFEGQVFHPPPTIVNVMDQFRSPYSMLEEYRLAVSTNADQSSLLIASTRILGMLSATAHSTEDHSPCWATISVLANGA